MKVLDDTASPPVVDSSLFKIFQALNPPPAKPFPKSAGRPFKKKDKEKEKSLCLVVFPNLLDQSHAKNETKNVHKFLPYSK